MKIILKPSDLIERFVWDKYTHFCLNKVPKSKIKEIIDTNDEFEISEQDAFVIGLTGVIYTNNIVYKFKQYVKEIIENKSFEFERRNHLNKMLLLDYTNVFKSKIPENWKSDDIEFNKNFEKIDDLYNLFLLNVNNLITITVQDWPCVRSGQVKKIINKI